mgnify:FL=1
MKKVVLRVKGGLGNQLFIFAFGKFMQKELKYNVKYDLISGFLSNQYKHIQTNKSLLTLFFKDLPKASVLEVVIFYFSKKFKILDFVNIKYLNKEYSDEIEIRNQINNPKFNYYLEGYFQSSLFTNSNIEEI